MEKLRIIFMGTPDFAVGILDTIYNSQYEIAAVITGPDKPAGRGRKVTVSAVKTYALDKNIPILQPTNLKSEDFLNELAGYNANLQIVVAFRMLPEVVWRMPKYGTFNLHASLLPNYRGAAPINWAIINGETETGVTTFFIDDAIDTGAMILNHKISIEKNENVGQLHDKLMHLGCETVIETLHLIQNGKVETSIQSENSDLKTAYKLNKANCKIDWSKPGNQIYNQIRGLCPYPGAWTFIKDGKNEWNVKIYDTTFIDEVHNYKVGQISIGKKEMKIAVSNGFLQINSLQFPGKNKMQIHELLNGTSIGVDAYVA